MATSRAPHKRLPDNPSQEHLRKQAKRLAKREAIALAASHSPPRNAASQSNTAFAAGRR
jgi:hypothetical protein